ncbi:MAG: biphenyl 2,3-dioxygenase [Myxococcales bacterium]|nr:biphenyl 2,3-dioxygenase [Myxococcales bacterium]
MGITQSGSTRFGVTQLGYIGLRVSDLPAWRSLATDVLGMEAQPGRSAEELYLRMDDRTHRLVLTAGEHDELSFVGWEVPDAGAFERQVERMKKAGISISPGSAEEKAQRRVIDLAKFTDPQGFPGEIYHGPTMDGSPFRAGRPISGFKTGSQGMGHVVVTAEDPDALATFYTEALGFRISEYMEFGGGRIVFLHCNGREHSLALVGPGLGVPPGQLHHIMVEVNSLDDVGRAYDLCAETEVPLVLTLGRHSNDLMTSFYLKTPSGFAVEYGHGGLEIDEATWQVRHYTAPKLWGHNPA